MSEISKLDQVLVIKKIDRDTVNLQVTDNETLMSIVGQFDQNLKALYQSKFFVYNHLTFGQCYLQIGNIYKPSESQSLVLSEKKSGHDST